MRMLAFVPLLLAAACSEGAAPDAKAEDKAALQLAAGQWETTAKYDAVTVTEGDTSAIPAAEGEARTGAACLAEADAKRPDPALFATAGDSCAWQNFYMSRGKLNADMRCSREGVPGDIMVAVQGSYTADSFDLTTDTRTILAGPGDIQATGTMTGRLTGPTCAPAEAAA